MHNPRSGRQKTRFHDIIECKPMFYSFIEQKPLALVWRISAAVKWPKWGLWFVPFLKSGFVSPGIRPLTNEALSLWGTTCKALLCKPPWLFINNICRYLSYGMPLCSKVSPRLGQKVTYLILPRVCLECALSGYSACYSSSNLCRLKKDFVQFVEFPQIISMA